MAWFVAHKVRVSANHTKSDNQEAEWCLWVRAHGAHIGPIGNIYVYIGNKYAKIPNPTPHPAKKQRKMCVGLIWQYGSIRRMECVCMDI